MHRASEARRGFLVEGWVDKDFFESILRKMEIDNFEFVELGGITNLGRKIKAYVKALRAESIGIILDTNGYLTGRWRCVHEKLREGEIKVVLPDHISRDGFVSDYEDQKIGIWLMPDNERSGELEDFVREMIPNTRKWELAAGFVNQAKRDDERLKVSKAEVYAWLSIRAPGKRFGSAVKKRWLNFDVENYELFSDWVRRLCR